MTASPSRRLTPVPRPPPRLLIEFMPYQALTIPHTRTIRAKLPHLHPTTPKISHPNGTHPAPRQWTVPQVTQVTEPKYRHNHHRPGSRTIQPHILPPTSPTSPTYPHTTFPSYPPFPIPRKAPNPTFYARSPTSLSPPTAAATHNTTMHTNTKPMQASCVSNPACLAAYPTTCHPSHPT